MAASNMNLTDGFLAIVRTDLTYDPDTGIFLWNVTRGKARAGKAAGYLNARGYVGINVARRMCAAHRLAWLYMHGEWPKGQIDHINGHKADNRLANLRDVTGTVNQLNRHAAAGRNPYPNVYRATSGQNRWLSTFKLNGRIQYVGTFDSPEEARDACAVHKNRFFTPQELAQKLNS